MNIIKQFARDYLEKIPWDKQPPVPELPGDVATKTAGKYEEALRLLIDKQQ
jgi:phosphoribosylaminoimidazole-succinocarboxamide synthase